jgi:hypothetical protein
MAPLARRTFTRSLLAVPAAALAGAGLGALAPTAASAAPADWDAHYVAGASLELFHRSRRGDDGTWSPSWDKIDTAEAVPYRVSCAGMYNGLNVVIAGLNMGGPSHGIRRADGTWTAFTRIPSTSGPTTGIPSVAVTARSRQLHVFGASEGGTTLYQTVRNQDGNWSPSWTALRSFSSIRQVATTRVGTTIDTAVLTEDDVLRHSIQAPDGTWTGWGNIGSAAGEIGGFYRVALAGLGSQLHVFALSQNGGVAYHAVRNGDGSWRKFSKLSVFANYHPFEICAANIGGEIHVGIIEITASNTQVVRFSIRRTDGTWRSVGTVSSSGISQPGILAVGGTERIL